MIEITPNIQLPESELVFSFMRSPGPGGQNVNKVETAVLLRFNPAHSSLPDEVKSRVISMYQNRLTHEGDLIIKASRYRSQERNRQDAVQRLIDLLRTAAIPPKKRKKTRPTFASKMRRLEHKRLHARTKNLRRIKEE